jgi:hypothetical protein
LPDPEEEPGVRGFPASPCAAGIEDIQDIEDTHDVASAPKPVRKTVRRPRNAAPSKFDIAEDE